MVCLDSVPTPASSNEDCDCSEEQEEWLLCL